MPLRRDVPPAPGSDKQARDNERKKLRDPTSHPPEADVTYEDGFVLLDCARKTLLRFDFKSEADQVHALSAELSGRPLTENEPLEADLPAQEAIVIDFVGRDRELAALWEWLLKPVAKRWALSGAGGKGKTAIAYPFALDVRKKAPEPFQAVLSLSAKKRKFESPLPRLRAGVGVKKRDEIPLGNQKPRRDPRIRHARPIV